MLEREQPIEARIEDLSGKCSMLSSEYVTLLNKINLNGESIDKTTEEGFWEIGDRMEAIIKEARGLVVPLILESRGDAKVMQIFHRSFVNPILQATEERYRQIDSRGRVPSERYMESPVFYITSMLEGIIADVAQAKLK